MTRVDPSETVSGALDERAAPVPEVTPSGGPGQVADGPTASGSSAAGEVIGEPPAVEVIPGARTTTAVDGRAPAAARRWPRRLLDAVGSVQEPILLFLLSRVALSVLAAYAFSAFVPMFEVPAPGYDRPPLDRTAEMLLGVWQRWDGQWYLKIATLGYNPYDGSYAFFPLYPSLIRAISTLSSVSPLVAGIAISNLAYLVGLIYLFRLTRSEFGPSVASRTILYLAVFPTAFYFFAVYTEALFFALTVAAFYYARGGRWWLAGLLGLLAALTRSTGLLLTIPFAVEYARQRHWDLRLLRPNVLAVGLPGVGIALFIAFSAFTTADALATTHAQIQWERHFTWPWQALGMGWQVARPGTDTPILPQLPGSPPRPGEFWGGFLESNGYNFVAALLGLSLAVVGCFKLPLPYSAYLAALVVFPLFSASQQLPLFSMPRFLVTAFPLFIVLALLGRHRWVNVAILYVCALLLGAFLVRFATWYWVA